LSRLTPHGYGAVIHTPKLKNPCFEFSLGSVISTIPEGMPERLVLPMQSPSLHKAPGVVGENLHIKPHLGVSTSGTENRRNLGGSPGTPDFEVSISGFIGNSQLMVIRKLQPATHMKRKILQEVLVFGLCSRSFILDAPMVEFYLVKGSMLLMLLRRRLRV